MTRDDRTPDQSQELVDAATKSFSQTAELEGLSNYTDLNRAIAAQKGQAGFNFSSPEGKNAMGQLLADVMEETYPDKGVMLRLSSPTSTATGPVEGSITLPPPAWAS